MGYTVSIYGSSALLWKHINYPDYIILRMSIHYELVLSLGFSIYYLSHFRNEGEVRQASRTHVSEVFNSQV